jgi:hypothetical protein
MITAQSLIAWYMTIHTGTPVTTARPNIAAGLPKGKLRWSHVLQIASMRPSLSWRRPWWNWLQGRVHYEFGCLSQRSQTNHLDLDTLQAHDTAVGLKCHMLWLDEEKLFLRCPRPWPRSSFLTDDKVMTSRCERVLTAWLEDPLEVANCVVEPSLKSYYHEGLYIARTLVQAWKEVPVTIVNVSNWDQMLPEGTILGHCKPVTCVDPYYEMSCILLKWFIKWFVE